MSAYGTGPLAYEWRLNGMALPNATNATLLVTNVQATNLGGYTVVITNSYAAVTSVVATLGFLVDPFFALHPLSQSVLPGANVTFSAAVSNGATLPITYIWRRGSLPLATQQLDAYFSYFVVTNAQPAFGNYRVDIANSSLPFPGKASSRAFLTFLTDTNSNGLADSWEADYFGVGAAVNPDDDPDHDGLTSLQEYRAGTNPTNAQSTLRIDGIVPGAPTMLNFAAASNQTYSVQSAARPEGPWSWQADVVARPTNDSVTVTVPTPATNGFYRLVTPRQGP